MATRRLMTAGDWAPSGQTTRIETRALPPKEPRDERIWLPKRILTRRPTPLDVELAQSRAPGTVSIAKLELVQDPEVVDFATHKTWTQQDSQGALTVRRSLSGKRGCPSVTSRQSQMSFGILDYYTRDVTPVQSPVKTAVPDPAIEKFEFGFSVRREQRVPDSPDVKAGAEKEMHPLPSLPPARPPAPVMGSMHKKTYSIFPPVKEPNVPSHRLAQIVNESPTDVEPARLLLNITQASPTTRFPSQILAKLDTTPSRRRAQTLSTPSPPETAYPSRVTSLGTPSQSRFLYRPRKESLVSSVRSRKDSCQSRLIPLRILSTSSTSTPPSCSSASTSTPNDSPDTQSRWSDDAITSPVAVTTPGFRTSFGSMTGRDSLQYPACFFEDDDEAAPLRSKTMFRWRRSESLVKQKSAARQGRGRLDEKPGVGAMLSKWLLCGGCASRGR